MGNKFIGAQIKKVRKEKKWSRDKLGEKAGLSVNYIGAIERGEKLPKLETFIRLVNVLEVDINIIIGNNAVVNEKAKWSKLYEEVESLDDFERNRAYDILKLLTKNKRDSL